MKKLKLLFRVVFGRTAFVLLFLLIQVGFLFSCIRWLSEYLVYIYGGIVMLTVLVVVHILNEKANPSFKIAWMVPVLVIPVFGVLLYLFVQVQIGTKVIAARLKAARKETDPFLEQSQAVYRGLERKTRGWQIYPATSRITAVSRFMGGRALSISPWGMRCLR